MNSDPVSWLPNEFRTQFPCRVRSGIHWVQISLIGNWVSKSRSLMQLSACLDKTGLYAQRMQLSAYKSVSICYHLQQYSILRIQNCQNCLDKTGLYAQRIAWTRQTVYDYRLYTTEHDCTRLLRMCPVPVQWSQSWCVPVLILLELSQSWCGPTVPSSLVPLVQRSHSSLVPRSHSSLVPRSHSSLVPRSHSSLVPWSHSSLVPRSHSSLVPFQSGPTVPFQSGPTVPFQTGPSHHMLVTHPVTRLAQCCLTPVVVWNNCNRFNTMFYTHNYVLMEGRQAEVISEMIMHGTLNRSENLNKHAIVKYVIMHFNTQIEVKNSM